MRNVTLALSLLAVAAPLAAQTVVRTPRAQAFSWSTSDDRDRAMLGISTSTSGRRDTLGLLVSSVTTGGPADKAGIEEGSRLQSINGINLKLSRDDAADDDMQSISYNRLTREMRKVKPGDDVTLEVYAGGRTRTVKVKTVSAADLNNTRELLPSRAEERAAVGVMLSSTGNKRDTLGVFVTQVVEGGPADKAGLVEGDRIASINGVDVRVPREDAGDASVAMNRIDRLEREIGKLKPGQVADLGVISGGRSRSVKVTTVKSTDLPETSGFRFSTGDGGMIRMFGPGGGAMTMPRIRVQRPDGSTMLPRLRINRGAEDDDFDASDLEYQLREHLKVLDGLGPMIQKDLNKTLPRAMDELRYKLQETLPAKVQAKIYRGVSM